MPKIQTLYDDTQYEYLFISEPRLSFQDYPSSSKSNLTYFIKGCDLYCRGCQNLNLQKYENKDIKIDGFNTYKVDKINIEKSIETILDKFISDSIKLNRAYPYIVLQGGDPFSKYNRLTILYLLDTVIKNKKYYDSIKFCIYTGYTFCEIYKCISDFFKNDLKSIGNILPFIKCGKYNINNLNENPGKNDHLLTFASKNQKLYSYDNFDNKYICASKNGVASLDTIQFKIKINNRKMIKNN
jgi:hypothetical protein